MTTTVCVIGAGAIGLCSMKTLKEEGFHVTGFEARDYVGGLWKDSPDSTISVHETTIFNSSKWRSGFSDFPFSDETDVYPTAGQMYEYLGSYARHFELLDRIHLGTKVLQIQYEGEKWAVTVQNVKTHQSRTEYFDKVCVATGTFHKPRWPTLEGIEDFEGRVLHSIDFHGSEDFKGQNVLLIGMHASAQDVAASLSENAEHVYMSHRGGLIILPRYTENGSAFDTTGTLDATFIMASMMRYVPTLFYALVQSMLTKLSKKHFPYQPQSWGLSPAPSLAVSTPLMADVLYSLMKSGFAEPVPEVRRIKGPHAIELTDGRTLDDINTIIYCTGYYISLPPALIPLDADAEGYNPYPPGSEGKVPRLYHGIFPLHKNENIRNSLAFIGQGAIVFPGLIQNELNVMATSQIWKGKSRLPPLNEMEAWYAQNLKRREGLLKRYSPREGSTFYPVFLDLNDHLRWVDEVAGTALFRNLSNGWFSWRAWKLWWDDRKFYQLLKKGIFTPALYKLFDTGKRKALPWEQCKQMIISENQRAEAARKAKLASMEAEQAAARESRKADQDSLS